MTTERKKHAKLPGRLRIIQRKRSGAYSITVPKELADDLGWTPGTVVEFVRHGGRVMLVRHDERAEEQERCETCKTTRDLIAVGNSILCKGCAMRAEEAEEQERCETCKTTWDLIAVGNSVLCKRCAMRAERVEEQERAVP